MLRDDMVIALTSGKYDVEATLGELREYLHNPSTNPTESTVSGEEVVRALNEEPIYLGTTAFPVATFQQHETLKKAVRELAWAVDTYEDSDADWRRWDKCTELARAVMEDAQ